MQAVDYLIVGSGLTGATLARLLADAGQNVLVLERRSHVGGNVHDQLQPSGIRVHTYGPHYFRTSSDRIWAFVNRFARFYRYEARLKSFVDGQYESWPLSASTIRRLVGEGWQPGFKGTPTNFEEASLSMMPRLVYQKFVKGYTEKQWGVPGTALAAELARRFQVRADDDTRLTLHKHQGIPFDGYHAFMQRMLAGIPVVLNVDYLAQREAIRPRKFLVFTGPIDEFFDYRFGRLKYRGQRREQIELPDVALYQPCGQINNPDPANGPHIRTLEWKHMMPPEQIMVLGGTIITREVPITPDDPDQFEYPFPDHANRLLYQRYSDHARSLPQVLICGRLGEYRYYDMDQAIARAMVLFERVLRKTF